MVSSHLKNYYMAKGLCSIHISRNDELREFRTPVNAQKFRIATKCLYAASLEYHTVILRAPMSQLIERQVRARQIHGQTWVGLAEDIEREVAIFSPSLNC